MEDLIIYQGDTAILRATIKSGLSPADCSGYTSYLIAKEDTNGTTKAIDLSTNNWDSSTALFTTTSEDTNIEAKKYQYENYVSDGSSNTFTVGQGTLEIRNTYR